MLPEAPGRSARLLLVAQLRHGLIHTEERGASREQTVRATAGRGAPFGGRRRGGQWRRRSVERHTEIQRNDDVR